MFRFRGKKFFITYPQCDLALDLLLEGLKIKFLHFDQRVSEYVVANELHEDGNKHRHVFVAVEPGLDVRAMGNVLDVEAFHPNIQAVRSADAVLKYCVKEGDYITNIPDKIKKAQKEESKMNKREVGRRLKDGEKLITLVEEYPELIFNYSRLKTDISMYMLEKNDLLPLERTCGIWLSGPPGSGKSTIATTRYGEYYFKGNNKWWDGYNSQPTAVCEDVDESWTNTFYYLKIWSDRYVFTGETKGGQLKLRPKFLIVTSNYTIEELCEKIGIKGDHVKAYTRRFVQFWFTSLDDFEERYE